MVYFFINRRFSKISSGRNISIIERRYIDRNSSIILVRLVEDYYFILVTQNGGTVIKKLSDVEAGKIEIHRESFSDVFFRKLGRKSERK